MVEPFLPGFSPPDALLVKHDNCMNDAILGQSSLAAMPVASRNKDDGLTAATKSVGGADW